MRIHSSFRLGALVSHARPEGRRASRVHDDDEAPDPSHPIPSRARVSAASGSRLLTPPSNQRERHATARSRYAHHQPHRPSRANRPPSAARRCCCTKIGEFRAQARRPKKLRRQAGASAEAFRARAGAGGGGKAGCTRAFLLSPDAREHRARARACARWPRAAAAPPQPALGLGSARRCSDSERRPHSSISTAASANGLIFPAATPSYHAFFSFM